MIMYCLMAMRRFDKKPTILIVNYKLKSVFPVRDFENDEFTTYNEYRTDSPPLIRYNNCLFWIERYDQPAWKAIEK